ncbi:TPA: ATP-binding cassette domain-containing protein [Streptococcus suis]|uniref:ATP-binding cassette domain-containing protein n=1 Tax=Streptococcus suivaginalis TaxID=3028082 RepID=A0AA97A112_9STRE|nr:ATP-binding cassette domain-containing protein [Streptococcus sp. 29896]MCK4028314.1 ATP-binding cassette domain-containing protein [Streptococcus suis]WNY47345.1 ATP-binding cassette domain-containing protein [Streptococcus sp. 29896]HEL1585645.1 ATP-binding cassette domain-containing protein [Streptococcus suis]
MIEAQHLSKTYYVVDKEVGLKGSIKAFFKPKKKAIQAVQDISLSIQQGEIVGYIGSNGSGKSTTIKMLTGVLHADEGTVTINGLVPKDNRKTVNKQIGVLFGQKSHLDWNLPVQESFILHAKIYDVPEAVFQERLARLIDLLDLADIMKQSIRNLSLGQRVRCEFAAIFLHQPSVVFLDEPTIGLDASVKETIRAFIRYMNEEHGTTFLITSHDMKDIETLCERIFIIDKGKKVYDGSLSQLKERFSQIKTISFSTEHPLTKDIEAAGLEFDRKDDYHFDIHYQASQWTSAQVITMVFEQIEVDDVTMKELEIESIVRQIYEEGIHA